MKKVKVTLELTNDFVALLNAKATLRGWTKLAKGDDNPPAIDAGDIVAWLVLMEARGCPEADCHAATPFEWRNAGIEVVHSERRVVEVK